MPLLYNIATPAAAVCVEDTAADIRLRSQGLEQWPRGSQVLLQRRRRGAVQARRETESVSALKNSSPGGPASSYYEWGLCSVLCKTVGNTTYGRQQSIATAWRDTHRAQNPTNIQKLRICGKF